MPRYGLLLVVIRRAAASAAAAIIDAVFHAVSRHAAEVTAPCLLLALHDVEGHILTRYATPYYRHAGDTVIDLPLQEALMPPSFCCYAAAMPLFAIRAFISRLPPLVRCRPPAVVSRRSLPPRH